jgi:hypothetical protein
MLYGFITILWKWKLSQTSGSLYRLMTTAFEVITTSFIVMVGFKPKKSQTYLKLVLGEQRSDLL